MGGKDDSSWKLKAEIKSVETGKRKPWPAFERNSSRACSTMGAGAHPLPLPCHTGTTELPHNVLPSWASCPLVPSPVTPPTALLHSLLEVPILTCFYPSTDWLSILPHLPLPSCSLSPFFYVSSSSHLDVFFYQFMSWAQTTSSPSFSSSPSLCAETHKTKMVIIFQHSPNIAESPERQQRAQTCPLHLIPERGPADAGHFMSSLG